MKRLHLVLVLAMTATIVVALDEVEPSESPTEPTTTTTQVTSTTTPATTTTTTTTTTPKPSAKSNKSTSKPKSGGADCPTECLCSEKKISCDDKELASIPNLTKHLNKTVISLKYNRIQQLDFNMLPPNLETLDLSNNAIKTIVPVSKKLDTLLKLRKLSLSYNQITNLTSSWKFPALEILDISYNPINLQEFTFASFAQLINLNMSGVASNLGDKLFASNQRLETLNLTSNSLIEIPFALRGTASIKNLILNENLMTSLRQSDFVNRTNLIRLEIRRCSKLTKVDELAFSNLNNLKELIIADNPKLKDISKDAFKSEKTHMLDLLDLSGNNFTTMSNPLEFSSVTFEKILLNNNPWDCNCELGWFQLLSQKSPPIHCKTPEQFRDIESSQYFLSTDCEPKSSYHSVIVTGFLIFLLVLLIAIFVQRSEVCRRLLWKDQYGTIYYTKASFPPETV